MRRGAGAAPLPLCSIAEVARAVGYPRTSSFTVAFERVHGCSPTAWRSLVALGRNECPGQGAATL